MSYDYSVRRGQPAAQQGWGTKERMADGLQGIKHVAYATLAAGATAGASYLLYNYPPLTAGGMPIKAAALLVAGGIAICPIVCTWNAASAKYAFQSMWKGRQEMRRLEEAEMNRVRAEIAGAAQRTAGAVAGYIGSLFTRQAQA